VPTIENTIKSLSNSDYWKETDEPVHKLALELEKNEKEVIELSKSDDPDKTGKQIKLLQRDQGILKSDMGKSIENEGYKVYRNWIDSQDKK